MLLSQAERDKFLNKEISQLEGDKKNLQSKTSKTQTEIAALKEKKQADSESVAELDEKLKRFDQDKGETESKKLEIYNQEVLLKQKIKELQKSQYESTNKIQQRKREIEELDKKLDNGMPNGCAKALRFLDDYCKRQKVKTLASLCRFSTLQTQRRPAGI